MKKADTLELALWSALLLAVNLPLLLPGGTTDGYALSLTAVQAGEWWRIPLHPLAHLSLYHLAVDAAALLFLLRQLDGTWRQRLFIVALSALGASALALADPRLSGIGLRGLSGVGHGLMAAVGCQLVMSGRRTNDRADSALGWLLLGGVLGKSLWEVIGGGALFIAAHLGEVGTPIPLCHLGGVIGGILGATMLQYAATATVLFRDARMGNK